MNVIHMEAVAKSYGGNQVLDGLDLEIGAGEVFALLGPNGAGKTTAVEILEGYRRADDGRVSVLGVDPADGGARFRSRIGIVLQQTTSFEKTTVAETVEMFAALFPDPLSPTEALSMVGLDDRPHHVADTLSGGQRRRLDVACGLVGRPELLFLDEPTTGLDPEARRAMWNIIAGLRAEGVTILLTTHYLDEAEVLANRIGILLDGRLQEVAEPSRVAGRHDALARVRFVPTDREAADIRAWHTDGDAVWFETDRPAETVARLVARHGELQELTVTRPTLEDVYLDLIQQSQSSTNSEPAR
ncbi:MAG: ABC transporter ATP-binding protein [Acidimicrobiales bacterium]